MLLCDSPAIKTYKVTVWGASRRPSVLGADVTEGDSLAGWAL